ncbi:5'/3'-nucleotidase SurE [Pseudobythopirellula maris]|nr:5'/3'-nucleotidase SurE [Pseudobythopirellula maris]
MRILLTNDDGIYAPGLEAMRKSLERLGEVTVVAPATEQSGVGHSITFLTPLMASEVYDGDRLRGWAVEGSPADCVKLAAGELCDGPIDLCVSGVNGGLNVGINVLYSGTVAAASEAALHGLPSIAVSLEWDTHPRFDRAAALAAGVIEQMLERDAWRDHPLYNLNVPTSAVADGASAAPELRITTMGVTPWTTVFHERQDPKGRRYYWVDGAPPAKAPAADSDLVAVGDGALSLSPLLLDRTQHNQLESMRSWGLTAPESAGV